MQGVRRDPDSQGDLLEEEVAMAIKRENVEQEEQARGLPCLQHISGDSGQWVVI